MSSKANPGKYDCYKAAHPNEEMFVLLGRDDFGFNLVRLWIALRLHQFMEAIGYFNKLVQVAIRRGKSENLAKMGEAFECAQRMENWNNQLHLGWTPPKPKKRQLTKKRAVKKR